MNLEDGNCHQLHYSNIHLRKAVKNLTLLINIEGTLLLKIV